MPAKVELSAAVEEHQLAWLHDALTPFKLPDVGKALRCVLVYVQQEADAQLVFGQVSARARTVWTRRDKRSPSPQLVRGRVRSLPGNRRGCSQHRVKPCGASLTQRTHSCSCTTLGAASRVCDACSLRQVHCTDV
jgi:hypothetical protein